MTKKERHIVALDIGSTKTCALIGEMDDEGGGVKFAALGAAESKGWRKGQIVNLDLAVSSIRRAVEEAESIVSVPVESALIGVAGVHVRGVNSRGGVTIGARPRDVQRDDVRRAIEAARGIQLPEDREVLHVLPQEFFLDTHDNIRDAIGMVGQRLEANVHIVTAPGSATQNIAQSVRAAASGTESVALNVGNVHRRLRRLHVQLLEGLRDDLRYRQVAEPLVVRRNNKPWRVIRARLTQHLLEGGDVIVPVRAFLVVGLADLPLPGRVFEPLLEAG